MFSRPPKKVKKVRLPKGGGRYRTIYIPDDSYRKQLRTYLPELNEIAQGLNNYNHYYAFRQERNCVIHAFQHIGYSFTVSMDLLSFFEHVSSSAVAKFVPQDLVDYCFVDGAPMQGLPTSPVLANIGFLDCDLQISNALRGVRDRTCYTRYADDIYVSFDDRSKALEIERKVRTVVSTHGFRLNERKTKLQRASDGRVVITGIGVDSQGVYPTRKSKKQLRAALHQGNYRSVRGLREWMLCKFPVRKGDSD